jgi:hypothetical protein
VTETERRTVKRVEALLPSSEFTAQVASGRSQTINDAFNQARQTLGGQAPEGTW